MSTHGVAPGLSRLVSGERGNLRRATLGLLAHPASVTERLTHSADALISAGYNLEALFGPQHGMRGEKQDNMIESEPYVDRRLGIPVHSLYGAVRKPTREMLDGLDVLLCDLQDVGVRVYTFIWTMTLAMEACRDAGVKLVVLDRPNPITGESREGPVLQREFESFVGLHPLPLRHGLTAGEVARLANEEYRIGCELDVVPCKGWRRSEWFDETGLPFVMPSPNLPTLDSCVAYPGMVLLEGTNLSEGRGTTRPFEVFGAPFLDEVELVENLERRDLPGVVFRPCCFEPTFQKHAGELCRGAQLHVIDRDSFRPVETAVSILHAARELAPGGFAWRPPPYEYEQVKMPIDILWGGDTLRLALEAGTDPAALLAESKPDLDEFSELVEPFLLYD